MLSSALAAVDRLNAFVPEVALVATAGSNDLFRRISRIFNGRRRRLRFFYRLPIFDIRRQRHIISSSRVGIRIEIVYVRHRCLILLHIVLPASSRCNRNATYGDS